MRNAAKLAAGVMALTALTSLSAMGWSPLPSWPSDEPGFTYTPSPADWRSLPMYQIVTDRFADGDSANNAARGLYEPWHELGAHGGDFAGIRAKLGYLDELGIGSIWISPVLYNIARGSRGHFPYHAYSPTDLNRIEPQFGSLDELRSLIRDAHQRGMYVIIDIVVNHLGDLASSFYGDNSTFNPAGFSDMWWHQGYHHAPPFEFLSKFHNNGAIVDFDDPTQAQKGELLGLDDLRTEDPYVRQDLIAIYKALIDATDCDGYRIDAVRHVEVDFWDVFASEIRTHAASLGKTNFLVFGEVFHHAPGVLAPYIGETRFHSMLDFPKQDLIERVFARGEATDLLVQSVVDATNYHQVADGHMVSFIDNHDMPRMLSDDKMGYNIPAMKAALAWLYTSPGIPLIYYGTEQGFNGGGDPWNREDMFDGQIEFGPSEGDNFNTSHELYTHIRDLIRLRRDYPALTAGDFEARWSSGTSAGLFAFARTLGTQEVIAVVNTRSGYAQGSPAAGDAPGALYADLFDPSSIVQVSSTGTLNLTLGAYGIAAFIPVPSAPIATLGNTWHWPFDGDADPVDSIWINTETTPPSAAQTVTVSFSIDGTNWTDVAMVRDGEPAVVEKWHVNLGLFAAGTVIRYRVTAGDATQTLTDPVAGHYKITINAPPPVEWTGHMYQWPPDGSVESENNLWINCDSWRRGRAAGGYVTWSTNDGASWADTPLEPHTPTDPSNDGWHANLGTFPGGTRIQYAVACSNDAGALTWVNDGQVFTTTVVIDLGEPLRFVGHSWSWPFGNAKPGDDVWINTETWPKNAAVTARVAYTLDGSHWQSVPMVKAGTSGNNDWWHINMGQFSAGTTIRYAIYAEDAYGDRLWDSNNSHDYFITIASP